MRALVFFTSLTYAGKTKSYIRGAEVRFIETVKRFGEEIHIIVSIEDCRFLKDLGLKAVYHPYKHEDTKFPFLNIILRSMRAYKAFLSSKIRFD